MVLLVCGGCARGFFLGIIFWGEVSLLVFPAKARGGPASSCFGLVPGIIPAVRKPGMGHLGCKTRSRLALTQAVVVFAEISDTPPESLPIPVPFHRNDKMQ